MFSSPQIQDEETMPYPGKTYTIPKIEEAVKHLTDKLVGIMEFKMGIPWSIIKQITNDEAAAQEDLAAVWLLAYDSSD